MFCAVFFFFNDTATTEIYTLSLHDALPIYVAAVGEQVRRKHAPARIVSRPENRDARAVAEQHRGVPAAGRLVEPARVHLGADQQHATVLARADPGVGDREAIDEARALVTHVDGRDVGEAELALEEHAVAGLEVVGGAGAIHDAIEVGGLERSPGERLQRGRARQAGSGLAVREPV